ncbi:zf-TFIIB domain-containing protein [Plantactinospora siamensis]|uniref:Zf-TFIIB domain-containing protein n=1 Tax=Plantactinospora siamensis TaxID=555372 RepID=A0ABV6NQM5_9ACTN
MQPLTCPKCRGAMRQYERSGVTVDQCDECRGIFLDRGELEKLFEAETQWNSQHAAPPPGVPGPPPPVSPQPGYGAPGQPPPGYPPAPAYPPGPAYGSGQHPGYHGHYRQKQHGYHGHYRRKRHQGFLGQLFD